MDEHDQREVARGLREGRAKAWRALYDAFAAEVWRWIARRMGPDAAEVADVVQETFLAAARSARGFDPARGSPWGWLVGIARRQVALHHRKRYRGGGRSERAAPADSQSLLDWLEGRQASPPDMLHSAELHRAVHVALARLPDEQEGVLTARYLDGRSVEEIATAQRCSESAVRSRLARARRAFRRVFARLVPSADGRAEVRHES